MHAFMRIVSWRMDNNQISEVVNRFRGRITRIFYSAEAMVRNHPHHFTHLSKSINHSLSYANFNWHQNAVNERKHHSSAHLHIIPFLGFYLSTSLCENFLFGTRRPTHLLISILVKKTSRFFSLSWYGVSTIHMIQTSNCCTVIQDKLKTGN